MPRKYQITIYDRHQYENESADSTTILYGEMDYSKERCVIKYTEESGDFTGMQTEVIVDGEKQVSIVRKDSAGICPQLELCVEMGKRHNCQYNTPYGLMIMGTSAYSIESRMSSFGGYVKFKYDIDIDGAYVSTNTLQLTVKEIF